MIRNVLKHAAIYSFASILGKGISFVMLPFYAHMLHGEGYGVIGMLDAALSFLSSLLSFGIVGSTIRFYNDEPADRQPFVISTAMRLMAFGGGALVVLCCLCSKPLSYVLLGDTKFFLFVAVALIAFWLDLVGGAASTLLLIEQRSTLYSMFGLLRLVVGLSLNIVLIVTLEWGLWGYFTAVLLTALVWAIPLCWIVIKRVGFRYDRAIAKKIIDFELPMVPANLVSFASRQAERVLIRLLVGLEGVGILEMCYKLSTLLPFLLNEPFMRTWFPRSIEIAANPDGPKVIGRVFTFFLFLAAFVALVLGTGADDFLRIMTPPEFWQGATIARLELLTAVLTGVDSHVVFGLAYQKLSGVVSWIKTTTSLLKVGLSVMLVSAFGLKGAAYSALICVLIQVIWTIRRSQAVYRIEIEWRKVAVLTSAAIALYCTIILAVSPDFAPVEWLGPRVAAAITGIAGWIGADTTFGQKLVHVASERGLDIASLAVKSVMCLAYLVCLPLVNVNLWRELLGILRGARSASS
ncbi:MAG: lipopolysaccharide biosynthesis protein [Acidobacteriota bacterium]